MDEIQLIDNLKVYIKIENAKENILHVYGKNLEYQWKEQYTNKINWKLNIKSWEIFTEIDMKMFGNS